MNESLHQPAGSPAGGPGGGPADSAGDPAGGPSGDPAVGPSGEHEPDELRPLALSSATVTFWGTIGWLIALALTLAVPSLHEGDRHWWPWTCVAAIVLGGLGFSYVRRGRGNAAGAE